MHATRLFRNTLICLILCFSAFAEGCKNESGSKSSELNSKDSSSVLTAEQINALKSIVNQASGDHYIGTPEELKKLVEAFVTDNSKADAVSLYISSGTAIRQNMIKEAGFLFYAAQLRKHLDYARYGLGQSNGNNIQTYLGFLNETEGQAINAAICRDPQNFSAAVDMIKKWNTIPSDDAIYSIYPKETYGTYKILKNDWQSIADTDKKSFMDEFATPQLKVLNDPKGFEAFNFVMDYNSGKIKQSVENDKKLEECNTYLQTFYKK